MEKAILVDKYTTSCSHFASKKTSILEIAEMMEEEGIKHVPILEYDRPVGIISDRDLRSVRNLEVARKLTADEVMIPDPYVVKAQTPLKEVARFMWREKIGSAIVCDEDGDIYGIFTITDALRALIDLLEDKERQET